jgi:hypothetical protein
MRRAAGDSWAFGWPTRPALDVTKTDLAFWLGLYAAALASATGLWTLFRELWLERARLDVEQGEAWLVSLKGQDRPMIVRARRHCPRSRSVTQTRRPSSP